MRQTNKTTFSQYMSEKGTQNLASSAERKIYNMRHSIEEGTLTKLLPSIKEASSGKEVFQTNLLEQR